jgi:predicted small secreted protein
MKSVLLIAAIAAAAALSSCNTFIGLGRDLKQLGGGMENTADKATGWSGGAGGAGGGDTSGVPIY